MGKIEIDGKTRQNAENKQTFDLMVKRKIEIEEKSSSKHRKQTFDSMGKIELEGKTRQNAENKQTFDLTGKIKQGDRR